MPVNDNVTLLTMLVDALVPSLYVATVLFSVAEIVTAPAVLLYICASFDVVVPKNRF